MRTSDAHSCSCSHKLDKSANSDRDQSHILDNECLNESLVGCSWLVVEASLVVALAVALVDASTAVEEVVVASPFEEQRHPERLVAGELVVVEPAVGQVAETELVCGLERLDEEAMTSFEPPQMKRIRKERLHHHRPCLLQCATLRLPRCLHLQQLQVLRLRDYPNHQHPQQ